MSENTEEAKELAERSANQAKHAGKNSGKAVKALAEPALEKGAGAAKETVRLVQKGTGEVAEFALDEFKEVAEEATAAASKYDLGRILAKTSAGFLALSAASFCGAVGYNVFRELKNRPQA